MIHDREFWTPAELAEQMAVSTKMVRRMIQDGEIRAERVGRFLRIPRPEALRKLGRIDEALQAGFTPVRPVNPRQLTPVQRRLLAL